MKKISTVAVVAIVAIPVFLVLYPGHRSHVLSSLSGGRVFVAYDKKTMENMIDCAVTHHCTAAWPMELLLHGGLFCAEHGTEVAVLERFSFSPAKKIRILQGIHAGEVGWVGERMLKVTSHRGGRSSFRS